MALYMALLRAFFLSARASVRVMMPASISVFTCSVMIVLLEVIVRSRDIGRDRCFSSRGLTTESLPPGFKNLVGQVLVANRTLERDRSPHGSETQPADICRRGGGTAPQWSFRSFDSATARWFEPWPQRTLR